MEENTKLQIKFTNRWLYTFITLLIAIFAILSAYALYNANEINTSPNKIVLYEGEIYSKVQQEDSSDKYSYYAGGSNDGDSKKEPTNSQDLNQDDDYAGKTITALFFEGGESPNYYAKLGFDVIGNDMGLTSGGEAIAVRDTSGNFFYGGVSYADGIFIDGTTKNIGINTANPQNKLDVVGDTNITGTLYAGLIVIDGVSLSNLIEENNAMKESLCSLGATEWC